MIIKYLKKEEEEEDKPDINLKFDCGTMKCQFFFMKHIEQLQSHATKCFGPITSNITLLQ